MTLEEKVAQLSGVWPFALMDLDTMKVSQDKTKAHLMNGAGHISRPASLGDLGPVELAEMLNSIQKFFVDETRLGIPAIVHEECCSGFTAKDAANFPQAIGLASTWDPSVVEQMTDVIRSQMRAVGVHQGLSPVVDVTRDPRWGRVEETFGEDPYLVSRMGVAYVKGIQGKDLKNGVIATLKHFVGYGNSEGGMNWAPSHIPRREFLEVFLPPFEAAVKEAHAASVMNAYHELDGIPCASSKELLTDILREQWGFDGAVVSDYYSLDNLLFFHLVAKNEQEAAKLGLEAGLDVELPCVNFYGQHLKEALKSGLIKESFVDQAVKRVLKAKFELGLFEKPFVDIGQTSKVFGKPEQKDLAYKAAQKSIVLLKNKKDLLPLKKDGSSIAVIGPNADSIRNLFGDYSYVSTLECMLEITTPKDVVDATPRLSTLVRKLEQDSESLAKGLCSARSILDCIKDKVSGNTKVYYAKGCDILSDSKQGFDEAVAVAKKSDVAVVVVGDRCGLMNRCTCGEFRDRVGLGLYGVQEDLIKAIHKTGTPVVVVLINGRPIAMPWIAENVSSIIEAWVPGEMGAQAVADVLFGKYNPGGKLPISIPRDVGQVPVYYNHKPSGGRSMITDNYVEMSPKPLFPFGFGLSYTKFEYGNLKITPAKIGMDGEVEISLDIKNTGEIKGDEVVQLYVRDMYARNVTRPVKELKGFQRITLDPGEKRSVPFHLPIKQLAFYNENMEKVVEPGFIAVMVGSSSEDIRLQVVFEIE